MLNHSILNQSNHGSRAMRRNCFYSPIYNTKDVKSYLVDLVIENSHYEDLTFADKYEFAKLLIKIGGDEFLHESDKATLLGNIFKDDNDGIIEEIKHLAVDYYDDIMHGLFDQAKDDYQQERNQWLDYAAKYGDPDDAYDKFRDMFVNY